MRRQTIIYGAIYGLTGGVLIVVLRLIEFRFLIVEHSFEIYGGLIALLFAALGIWLGLKLTRKKEIVLENCVECHKTTVSTMHVSMSKKHEADEPTCTTCHGNVGHQGNK